MPIRVIKIRRDSKDWQVVSDSVPPQFLYPADQGVTGVANGWNPNTDIFETEEKIIIRLELAGVDKENLTIKTLGNTLVINGTRCDKEQKGRVYYHQMEINYGPFEKVIMLPPSLQEGEIMAQYHDGILEIEIATKSVPVEIPIQTEVKIKA